MKIKIIFTLILASIVFSLAIPTVAAEGDFPYKLTTENAPAGFELVSTTFESEYIINQEWKTPSDALGITILTVTRYNTTDDVEAIFIVFNFYDTEDISVEGSDEAISYNNIHTFIVARKGNYIATSTDMTSTTEDVITLLEAQMALHNEESGGGAPGFTLYISFLAIGAVTILLKNLI